MIFSNIDFPVVYVDPSAASAGDGTSPSSPLADLPSALATGTCYLVRRTAASSMAHLPNGTDASIVSLVLMGMPKSGDALYPLVPQEARDAWGSDAEDYARIAADTGTSVWDDTVHSLEMPNCTLLRLSRLHVFRDGQNACQAVFSCTDTNYASMVSVEDCRFGNPGDDLDDDAFESAPAHSSGMFVKCGKPLSFSMRRTAMLVSVGSSDGYSWGVSIDDASFVTVSDVDVWTTTYSVYGMGGGSPALNLSATSGTAGRTVASLMNIRGHALVNGSNGAVTPLLFIRDCAYLGMKGVSYALLARHLGSGTPDTLGIYTALVKAVQSREFSIDGIDIDLPSVWYNTSDEAQALYLTGYAYGEAPGASHAVRNISVSMASSGGIDSENSGNYYASYVRNTSYWTRSCAVRLDFTLTPEGTCSSHEPVTVSGVEVVHPRGIALYAAGCWLDDCTLQGGLRCSSATCDVDSVSVWYPGYAVMARNCSTVRVGTITLGKGSVSGYDDDPAIGNDIQAASSFVYAGSCNGILMSDTRGSTTDCDNCFAAVCGSERDSGHYTMRTANCVCDTWGVARSGSSSAASLKLSNQFGDGPGFMSLGREPFGGFAVAATAGSRTLTLYAAARSLTGMDALPQHLVVQATVPHADGTEECVLSTSCGRWSQENAGTWIGESSLSPWRLDLPLEIPADCTVQVRIHFKWYSSTGYLYIDPGISIA